MTADKTFTNEITDYSNVNVLVDRIIVNNDDDSKARYADSVQTAFFEGKGNCIIKIYEESETSTELFSNIFEADNIVFEEPNVNMFTFNNPVGACSRCEGFGSVIGIDENLVLKQTEQGYVISNNQKEIEKYRKGLKDIEFSLSKDDNGTIYFNQKL